MRCTQKGTSKKGRCAALSHEKATAFFSGFHPLFRCTHTAMRRGRRRCKIGIARSNAKTGHAESFLKFIKLAAHDLCCKAGAIWRTSQAALLLPSGQSRPCRPNQCKLAGNAASSLGRWEGSGSNCCSLALACLEMRAAGLLNLCCTTSAARANLGTLAHPKQRFCCLWGKAARAGETDVSLQGNAAANSGAGERGQPEAIVVP